MNRARKIILYLFLVFFLLIAILAVVAAVWENRIARLALEQVAKTTEIPIEVGEIDFSLIRNFPNATIQCKNVWVGIPESRDTLLTAGRLFVAVQAKLLLKKIFEIRRVELEDANLFYKIDTAGHSNIDFLLNAAPEEVVDTSANAIFLDIENFELKDVTLNYRDDEQKAKAAFLLDKVNLKGLINDQEYRGEAAGKIELRDCAWDGTNLDRMELAELEFKIDYNDGLLGIDEVQFHIDNDALIRFSGSVMQGDSLYTKLEVNVTQADMSALQKYLPDTLLQSFGVKDFSGILSVKASVSGMVADSVVPELKVDFEITDGQFQYEDYPMLRKLEIRGSATNGPQQNNASTSLRINNMSFYTDSGRIQISGTVANLDHPSYSIESKLDISLGEFGRFVPDSLVKNLSGNVSAWLKTSGTIPDSVSDRFLSDVLANTSLELSADNLAFSLDSTLDIQALTTKMAYKPGELEISKLSAYLPQYRSKIEKIVGRVQGDFLNRETLSIRFDTLKARVGESWIDLRGQLTNPLKPDYDLSASLHLNLSDVQDFVPKNMFTSLSGNVNAKLESAATLDLDSLSEHVYSLIFEKSRFDVELDKMSVLGEDSLMSVNNLTGKVRVLGDSLWLERLSAEYLGMRLALGDVSVDGLYSAVLLNQAGELRVNGDFSVDNFDYALVENLMAEDTLAQADSSAFTEPINFSYKINGRIAAKRVRYNDAVFSDVSSKFLVKENYYVLDSFKVGGFDGSALSSVKIEMLPNNKMVTHFKTDLKNMNVSSLMENFGEYIDYEEIKAENVKGKVSAKLDGEIVLVDFEPEYESMMLKGDLTIENGALLNVKPVMEVEKIPGIGLRNMDSLFFSTLNSSLFLFKNELYIPRTEIRSTSFDAMFLGMYSFGEDYAYHIRMFLGEVLSSKSKANLKKQARDAGFDEEDEKDITKGRTSIYVVSKSEGGKEKAGFDNKRDRANMVARVNLQQQMVNLNFHPKLVKYDTEK